MPTPPPVAGGRLTELLPLYPQTLNPLFSESESQGRLESLLFNGLMEINPASRLPTPALASRVQVSTDGKTYTFTLRPKLLWHDGTKVTASDVSWTFDILHNSEMQAPLQPYAQLIKTVTVVDEQTVSFVLSEPYSPFLARLATAPVIPRKPFAGLARGRLRDALLGWERPVGTGPFKWRAAMPGQSIELTANPAYFRGSPLIDGYVLRVLRDPTAIQQALNTGAADIAWLPPSIVEEMSDQDFITRTTMDAPTTTMLFFNLDPARGTRLGELQVRRGLMHALNIAGITTAMRGTLRPIAGYQPPISPAYRSAADPPYPYNLARARALLQGAGWRDTDGDGIRQKGREQLVLTLAVNMVPAGFPEALGTPYTPAVQRIVADWKAVGAQVVVRQEGWERLAGRLFNARNFDIALLSVSGDADPDQSYLWSTQAYGQGYNIGRYNSPRVDLLLIEGAREPNPARRLQVYDRVGETLASDLPAGVVGVTQVVLLHNTRLVGAGTDYWSALQHTGVERWWVQDGQ